MDEEASGDADQVLVKQESVEKSTEESAKTAEPEKSEATKDPLAEAMNEVTGGDNDGTIEDASENTDKSKELDGASALAALASAAVGTAENGEKYENTNFGAKIQICWNWFCTYVYLIYLFRF